MPESGGKTQRVKKISILNDNCVEKLKKQPNIYAREGEIKSVFYINRPIIFLVYKEAYFNSNDRGPIVPSMDVIFFFCRNLMIYFPMTFLVGYSKL
jgi:chemotaxis methyl-accepting protein methylase